jgi:hypothetical protein
MKSAFDKLNLRPGERRLMVIVGIVIFVVLNFLFVFPNFGAYGKTKAEIHKAELSLRRFKSEAAQKPIYERNLRDLQSQGVFVGEEDQALQLQRQIDSQANVSGVTVLQYSPAPRVVGIRTNSFFDEASLLINFNSGEKSLVDFLYNVGKGNSLVRVRSMNLGPELPNRYRLQGSLTVVESFQKKQVRPAAASTAPTKPVTAKTTPKPADTKTAPAPPKTGTGAKPPAANTKTNLTKKPGGPGK